jgi:hypothetical protein
VVAACAVNPVTGQHELSFMSSEREAALAAQASSAFAVAMRVIEEGAPAAYVRAIGERIAAESPRKDVSYHFNVADMAEPNAFALPGGYVYVSRRPARARQLRRRACCGDWPRGRSRGGGTRCPAGGAETLATLGSRVGNTWSTAQAAAANALPLETQLTGGQLFKIVVEPPYQAPRENADH